MPAQDKILDKEQSYKIIGACMKIHRALGPGFLEAVYEEALAKEFVNLHLPYKKQVKLNIFYEDQKLNKFYIADFICYEKIILEIKSVKHIPVAFYSQLNNYLTATKKELGILINFGTPSLTYKRVINTKNNSQ
ncbi:GxxExxY protein [Salinimicrobium sp. GXAS 041]|uniref:GxxExxY protein n=1 Tax=Salinimicrobium sp. GXAS 041 TaxID=3400806 RepID=UPI003C76C973